MHCGWLQILLPYTTWSACSHDPKASTSRAARQLRLPPLPHANYQGLVGWLQKHPRPINRTLKRFFFSPSPGFLLSRHLISKHDHQRPSGHFRFNYVLCPEDGLYRLQTTRLDSVEVATALLGPQTVDQLLMAGVSEEQEHDQDRDKDLISDD